MAKKTKRQKLVEDIASRLQESYGISERDLTSGSLFFETARVFPDEIVEPFFASYGVATKKTEFDSWPEFIEILADAILAKKKKR